MPAIKFDTIPRRICLINVTIESRLFLDISLMSILGTLTLDISAPTAQLSRDLDKAASMIRESSSRMIPTIGISTALQKDLRAGRSILNNSMQQMESDLGKYDLDNYSQEVDDLNSSKITPKVDDSQLTALNKHLSLKEEHLDRVVQKFSSQKIKPNFVAGDKIPDQSFNVTVNLRPENQEQIAKSTSRAIEKGLAQSKGKGLSLFDGVQLSIGQSIGKSLSSALKDITGFDLGKGIRTAAKSLSQPIKILITDNPQLKTEIAKIRADISENLDRAGYQLADAIVAGLDSRDGDIKSRLKAFGGELLKDNVLKNEGTEIFGKVKGGSRNVIDAVFPKDRISSYVTPFDEALTRRREKTIRERGIPAAMARAQEIISDGKLKNSGNAVTEDTQELIVATGGYARARGLSGRRLQQTIKDQAPEGTQVIWIKNTDSSLDERTKGDATAGNIGSAINLAKPNIRGYSLDATEMVAQALAAIEKNPEIKIKFIGESGGGFPAEEAAKTLQMMGKNNVEYLGVGTPDFIGGLNAQGQKILSQDEFLGARTQKTFQTLGLAKPSEGQSLLGVKGHSYENYEAATVAQLENFIKGKPEEFNERQIEHLKKVAGTFESMDTKSMNDEELTSLANQAYATFQLVERHVLGAVGNKKAQLETIAKRFESVYLKSAAEPEEMAGVRSAIENAKNGFLDINDNRGVEAAAQAKSTQKELQKYQRDLDALYQRSTGTIQVKYQRLSAELKGLIDQYGDPLLAVKGSKPDQVAASGTEVVMEPEVDVFAEAARKLEARKRVRQLRKPSIWDEAPESESFSFLEAGKNSKVNKIAVPQTAETKFDLAVDKFGRAVDKFANNQEKMNLQANPLDDYVEGEFEYAEQSTGGKVLSATRQALSLASQPIGQIGAVAVGAEAALFDALSFLKPLKGALQIGGTLAIGGVLSQNPVGQAAISATSSTMQTIANIPISEFAGLTSGAIEQVLSGALANLPGGVGLAQSIAVEVQRALQSGGVQVAGAIGTVLSPYLVARMGIGAAGAGFKQLMPGLQGNDNLASSTQRALTGAGRVVKQLMPSTTIEPFWDVEAEVVEDRALPGGTLKALPPGKKTVNPEWAKIVGERLNTTRSKVEEAIKAGNIELARQLRSQLEVDVNAAYRMAGLAKKDPNISKEDLGQISSILGNLKKKVNFLKTSGEAIDQLESGDVGSVKNKVGWSQQLKKRVVEGIQKNMGITSKGAEGGFIDFPVLYRALFTPIPNIFAGLGSSSKKPAPTDTSLNTPSFVSSTPPPPPPRPKFLTLNDGESQPPSSGTSNPLSKLVGAGKMALGVFAGFTAAALGVPAMIALGSATIETASSFEKLQARLAGASSSAQTGKALFNSLSDKADNLGISRSTALGTGAAIAGVTFGTELEGKPSEAMTQQILELTKSRGLNKDESQGLIRALSQVLTKPKVSAEEINQLTESGGISDARSIAARSLGLTPQQFAAQQASGAGIDSQKFVQGFLLQANQDSRTGADIVQNSIGAKQNKLEATKERFSLNAGNAVSPVFKAGLDAITAALGLLNVALEQGSTVLLSFALLGITKTAMALLPLVANLRFVTSTMAALQGGMAGAGAAALSMGKALAVPALQMAAFYLIAESVKQIGKTWSNTSQEIEDSANKIGASLAKVNKKPDPEKPKTASDVQGEGWFESGILVAQRGLKDLQRLKENVFAAPARALGLKVESEADGFLDSKQKEDQDRKLSVAKLIEKSSKATEVTLQTSQQGNKLTEIDRQLAAIDTEFSGLFASGKPDAVKLSDINKKKNALVTERSTLIGESIVPQQTIAQDNVNESKAALAKLESDFAKGQVPLDTYTTQRTLLVSAVADAEKAQIKLNEAVKSGLSNLTPWLLSLDKIAARFEDIGSAANKSRDALQDARGRSEISGAITKGGSERQATQDNEKVTLNEIKQRRATIAELKATLNSLNPNNVANVQKAYSVNDNTSVAQLKLAANGAANQSDKVTLEKLALAKEESSKVESLDSGLKNARLEVFRRIRSENREAALYYTSLAQQIDPAGTAFQKVISQMSREKNKFLSKLNNYGTGGFDVYTDAVIALLDVSKERMAAQAKAAQEKKAAIEGAFNRKNEDLGRRYDDYDTSVGSPRRPAPKKQISVLPPQEAVYSPVAPKAATPKATVPKATASIIGTVETAKAKTAKAKAVKPKPQKAAPKVKTAVSAAVNSLSPVQKKRYLTTSFSVDGKTDLGFDMRDPSEAALARKIAAGTVNKPVSAVAVPKSKKIPATTPLIKVPKPKAVKKVTPKVAKPAPKVAKPAPKVKSDPFMVDIESSSFSPVSIFDKPKAKAKAKPVVKVSKVGKGTKPSKQPKAIMPAKPKPLKGTGVGGKMTTTDWRDASDALSNQIAGNQVAKAGLDFGDTNSDLALREQKAAKELARKEKLAQQAARKQLRDQQIADMELVPSSNIQETQRRESVKQKNSFIDTREDQAGKIADMVDQIQNAEAAIELLAAKSNRSSAEESVLLRAQKGLPQARKTLQLLQAQAARRPEIEAQAEKKLAEDQAYQIEQMKERELIDRKKAETAVIRADQTNVRQRLAVSPYSEGLKATSRDLDQKEAKNEAEVGRIQGLREIEDRKRQDASYSPGAQAADRKRVERIYLDTLKNAGQKRSQDSVRAKQEQESELATNLIAQKRGTEEGVGIQIRASESTDKTDAPFANTRTIEMKAAQSLRSVDLRQAEKDRQYKEARIKYADNAALLASVEQQQLDSTKQLSAEKDVIKNELNAALADAAKQKAAYDFNKTQVAQSQSKAFNVAAITRVRQRGGDTKDLEYAEAVTDRKAQTSKEVFDLQQQKATITGMTAEADKARAEIDALIEGFYKLEKVDLSNIAEQFDRINEVIGDTQKATTSVLTDFVKTGNFDWKKILVTGLDSGINQIMNKIVPDLFSGLYRKGSAPTDQPIEEQTPVLEPRPKLSLENTAIAKAELLRKDRVFNTQLPQPELPKKVNPDIIQSIQAESPKRVNPDIDLVSSFVSPPLSGAQKNGELPTIFTPSSNNPVPVTIEGIQLPAGLEKSWGNEGDPLRQYRKKGQPFDDGTANYTDSSPAPNNPGFITRDGGLPTQFTPNNPLPVSIEGGLPAGLEKSWGNEGDPLRQYRKKGEPIEEVISPQITIAPQIMGAVGGLLNGGGRGGRGLGLSGILGSLIGGGAGGLLGGIGSLLGFSDGGLVPSDSQFNSLRAGNDPIAKALRKEGSNSIVAALTPGERVLSLSETRYYESMFPKGIEGYKDGGVVGGIKPLALSLDPGKVGGRDGNNEFNFNIDGGSNNQGKMDKGQIKDFENAVTAVLLKHKRAKTGLG